AGCDTRAVLFRNAVRALSESVFDGVAHHLRHVPDAEAAPDVHPMRFGCARADAQLLADLLAGIPVRHQAQHLTLAWSEPRGRSSQVPRVKGGASLFRYSGPGCSHNVQKPPCL